MKFSIGDQIMLRQSGEEGIVTSYIDNQLIEVEVNGTRFPVYINDIDHPYLKWFTDKNKAKKTPSLPEQLPVEKVAFRKPRLAKGVYLSFVPVFKTEEMEDIVDHIKIHLINEMPHPIKFVYDVQLLHKSTFKHEGTLHAFGDIYLHKIDYAEMNDQPRFNWQLTDTTNKALATAADVLRIRPQKLFEHINDVLHKGMPTFSYLLTSEFLPPKKEQKEKYIPTAKPDYITGTDISKLEKPKTEIDLHIEALRYDTEGLSSGEIITIQLDALQRYLQLAIVNKQERMAVIHGLGKGKLKDEVHKILKKTPEVFIFTNEWHGRYGFGATEIFFRY
jgi:hypothetical protein